MAKKRTSRNSSKCPEPFNTLIDIAGAATLHAYVKHKVKRDYARGEGETSAKAAAMVFGAGALRRGSAGILNLGGLTGLNSALKEIEKEQSSVPVEKPFIDRVSSTSTPVSVKTVPKYTWRQHCEDGAPYGISPDDYETADEYDEALQTAKIVTEKPLVIDTETTSSDNPFPDNPQEIKHIWRKYCSDGSPFGLNPEDYDSVDDYEEAIEEAKKTAEINL